MVVDKEEKEEVSSSNRGFLRQTQTQHRLPRSYYGGQRIYKMASTGDLVIQGEGNRPGDRRSHRLKTNCNPPCRSLVKTFDSKYIFFCKHLFRFASREDRGSRGELTAAVRSVLVSVSVSVSLWKTLSLYQN